MSSDNLTDSPEGPSCGICYNKLTDGPYAVINDQAEQDNKYHVQCLEQWVQKSKRGIILEKKIDSYSIYHDDTLVSKNVINQEGVITEETILIPSEEDSDSGKEYPCYDQYTKGRVICAVIGLAAFVVFLLVVYLIKLK